MSGSPGYLSFGHLSLDAGPGRAVMLGGTVSYAAVAAIRWGWSAAIATRAATDAGPAIQPLSSTSADLARINWCIAADACSTTFANCYDPTGGREQILLALAEGLTASDVPEAWRSPSVLHLAPIAGEFTPQAALDLIDRVQPGFVGLTPQGWLRSLMVGQPVGAAPWPAGTEALLARCDAVVLGRDDLEADPDPDARIAWLARQVPLLAVTRGPMGSSLWTRGACLHQPIILANTVDPTGAGDVYAATLFMCLNEQISPSDAARVAAAGASCAVEAQGAFGIADRLTVLRRALSGSD